MRLSLAALLLPLAACTAPTTGGGASKDGTSDDTGPADSGDSALPETNACDTLGLPKRAFEDGAETTALNGLAADFTVATTQGDWNFKENWTGCDSYLFIQDEPNQATGWPTELWARDVKDLFATLPDNVEIFFVSTLGRENKRTPILEALKVDVDKALKRGDDGDIEWWTPRVHYITTSDTEIEGWLGELMKDPGWGVGIDRSQHIRYIGSYADPTRYNQQAGWFEPNISMAANEPIYYNFEANRELAMEQEGATVVPIFTQMYMGGSVSGSATLPTSAEMAGYDTMTVDTRMACGGVGEYGYCPAWDYMAYLYMTVTTLPEENPHASEACQPAVTSVSGTCAKDGIATETSCTDVSACEDGSGAVWTCEGYQPAIAAATTTGVCHITGGTSGDGYYTCKADGTGYGDISCPTEIEVGRWITTYHREGRWVYDISAMLPFMADGGEHSFRYETSGPYTIDVSLRLSNQSKAAEPSQTIYAFNGGEHDRPWTFDVPADAKKVELATIISQHGSDGENCGEFCNIEHHFTTNGKTADEVVIDFPEADGTYQCQADTAIGTVPNQYGTWWYGRGGWCPGKEVPTVMSDITSQVTLGGENTMVYTRTRHGSTYNGGANVRMNTWVVVSR